MIWKIIDSSDLNGQGLTLCGDHSITSGKLLGQVLHNERQHKYLGQTVRLTKQVVELDVELITRAAESPTGRGRADVCLIELGGAVGQSLTADSDEHVMISFMIPSILGAHISRLLNITLHCNGWMQEARRTRRTGAFPLKMLDSRWSAIVCYTVVYIHAVDVCLQ